MGGTYVMCHYCSVIINKIDVCNSTLSESLVWIQPAYSDAEKKKHRRSYFRHVQPITEINILYGNNYKTRQTKLTNLTLPSCLTHQFIWLNIKVKKKIK